ncbi:RNA polymerase sigma-70 factor (ECF subfamily) [Herbihabitans rhizosphaerae]|uniref:RNA polymerase sigma factor n=1 Tax=Herbihabitans rhizosphaerae TaxID=1872711 RepID=A0A4Q7L7W3_9PSEU|nr:sigma-70 family RNA polymerase sigma factor [Herbihabitans rhizosphaerae]RZS44731.1 RNA polymerase sigma-70 factor (ECF subfamily) [Herbihabitans rhizosphaerae]
MDDDELTRLAFRAARGEAAAAEALVAATRGQLHRMLTYLADPRVAEDLVQETYLRAFAALPKFAGHSPARAWLAAIARNVAADHLRTRKRRPPPVLLGDASVADIVTTPDHGRTVVLRQLIAELDPERREAFVLTQVIGLPYADVARICDCPVGTIRSRVFRARDDLTRALAERDDPRVNEA